VNWCRPSRRRLRRIILKRPKLVAELLRDVKILPDHAVLRLGAGREGRQLVSAGTAGANGQRLTANG
jgi:hypothetical protein